MANFKRKAGYKSKRSCGLCKPWKRIGNSRMYYKSNKAYI